MFAYTAKTVRALLTPNRVGIKTFWWQKIGLFSDHPNFGDELTVSLVPGIVGLECTWSPPHRAELLGSGSTLEMVQRQGAPAGLKVWGSGFIASRADAKHDFGNPDFDFCAVRGKLTLDRIRVEGDLPLGDPGLLASRIYPRSLTVPGRVGLVYHYAHRKDRAVRDIARHGGITMIDPCRDAVSVAADITSCEFVFSSSLHGLIVADSFGIPNAWVSFPRQLSGGRYKFDDYYSAFDGAAVQHAPDIIGNTGETTRLERRYRGVPELDGLQDRLIKAFPFTVAD